MQPAVRMVEKLCGASLRALGRTSAPLRIVQLDQGQIARGAFFAPWLSVDPAQHDFVDCRGTADALALRYLHSDMALWREGLPETALPRALFDALEQFRCEYVFDRLAHPAVVRNIQQRFFRWCSDYRAAGLADSEAGLVFYTLVVASRVHLTGEAMDEISEELTEATRAWLIRPISPAIKHMKHARADQWEFAIHAGVMAQYLADYLVEYESQDRRVSVKKLSADMRLDTQNDEALDAHDTQANTEETGAAGTSGTAVARAQWAQRIVQDYSAFSTEFDQEISAGSLVASRRQQVLRQRLDQLLREQGLNVPRLTLALRQALASYRVDGWEHGVEEGILAPTELARRIVEPNHPVFRWPLAQARLDVAVTILIDNSGSMKRLALQPSVVMCDLLTRCLESAGARVELLGFTTGNVNGGRVMQQWRAAGEPENPGRLNELRHIVYKPFAQSWRRCRSAIACMLSAHYFRESIDAEALLWAAGRLRAQQAQRRIILMISDGLPMDTATVLANGESLLHEHLAAVTGQLDAAPDIELYGLGVGLDLGRWYRNALAISLEQTLNNKVFNELLESLRRNGQR